VSSHGRDYLPGLPVWLTQTQTQLQKRSCRKERLFVNNEFAFASAINSNCTAFSKFTVKTKKKVSTQ